jgi:hypothetical protein
MKLTGENRQLGEKPVPVPLCPPQISQGLDLGSNTGLRGERPATNRLSHGTASVNVTYTVLDFVLCDIHYIRYINMMYFLAGLCVNTLYTVAAQIVARSKCCPRRYSK